jgi:hypothetical protein
MSPVCLTASFDRLPSLLCRMDNYDLLATNIQEKTPKEVKKYYLVSRSGSNSQARICYHVSDL